MAGRDFYTNIMLDLECASVSSPNPVIIELAAVYFDIDTGAELDHFTTLINFQSCLDRGLVEDHETKLWLKREIPQTLAGSIVSTIPLHQALSEFSAFIERSCKTTQRKLDTGPAPRELTQPMIWGNGAVADNVWISSAYKACRMRKPWRFVNDMCVRTFVKQCSIMAGRDFRSEVVWKGVRHVALDDCRHQINYLVKARNELMPRPRVERMLLSPETSFSSVDGDVGQVVGAGSPLAWKVAPPNDSRTLDETSLSSVAGEAQTEPFSNAPISAGILSGIDGQSVTTDGLTQEPGCIMADGQRRSNVPCKVVKQVSLPGRRVWTTTSSSRRRNVPVKVPKQLLTPETSFSAEEYEKEYELGKQEDQRLFGFQ